MINTRVPFFLSAYMRPGHISDSMSIIISGFIDRTALLIICGLSKGKKPVVMETLSDNSHVLLKKALLRISSPCDVYDVRCILVFFSGFRFLIISMAIYASPADAACIQIFEFISEPVLYNLSLNPHRIRGNK